MPSMSWADVEAHAKRFIHAACHDCIDAPMPAPLVELFEGGLTRLLGISYGVDELRGTEAFFDPKNNELILSEETYHGLLRHEGRARFTLAHEIGHIVLHRPYFKEIQRDHRRAILLRRGDLKPYQNPEKQADVFASELLLPRRHVVALLNDGAELEDLVRIFRVSFDAARVKIERIQRS